MDPLLKNFEKFELKDKELSKVYGGEECPPHTGECTQSAPTSQSGNGPITTDTDWTVDDEICTKD